MGFGALGLRRGSGFRLSGVWGLGVLRLGYSFQNDPPWASQRTLRVIGFV